MSRKSNRVPPLIRKEEGGAEAARAALVRALSHLWSQLDSHDEIIPQGGQYYAIPMAEVMHDLRLRDRWLWDTMALLWDLGMVKRTGEQVGTTKVYWVRKEVRDPWRLFSVDDVQEAWDTILSRRWPIRF